MLRDGGLPSGLVHYVPVSKTEPGQRGEQPSHGQALQLQRDGPRPGLNRKEVPFWFSTRVGLAILCFLGVVSNYALRVNLSVAIVCMVNHSAINPSPLEDPGFNTSFGRGGGAQCDVQEGEDDSGPELNTLGGNIVWDKTTQGFLLGSFYWGYVIGQIPFGWLAIRVGGKNVFAISMLMASLATLFTPLTAELHYAVLLALRVLIGIASSTAFGSLFTIWTNWSPPEERTTMIAFTFAGAQAGIMVTFLLSGYLCQYGLLGYHGWPLVFYVTGGLATLWSVAWILMVSDSPVTHKRISRVEKSYILRALNMDSQTTIKVYRLKQRTTRVPWWSILSSPPVWAVVMGTVSFDWGSNTLLMNMPTYLHDVMHFDMASNGLWSALPFFGFWLVCSLSGWLADWAMHRELLSVNAARKLFDAVGKLVPAGVLVAVGSVECQHREMAVGLLVLAVSVSGLSISGFAANSVEIAPPYAGIIFSLANTMAGATGFLSALAVGFLTQENQTRSEWQLVFLLAAAVYVLGAAVFFLFSQAEVQDWALTDRRLASLAVEAGEEGQVT